MAAIVAVRDHHTRLVLMSLAVFAALAVVHTWPLASAPAYWSRIDGADAALNTWAVSWVGSQWDPLESTCRHASLSIL